MLLSASEVSGIGIVAGTAIGASMLSLPFVTGVSGFWFALALLTVSYFYSMATLLLWLEVTLYTKDSNANLITIAKERLGSVGERVAWFAYLFLLYAISMSYVAGGGDLLFSFFKALGTPMALGWCKLLYTLAFGAVAFRGVKVLDLANQVLLVGMLASYLGLVAIISPNMSLDYLSGGNAAYTWGGVPISVAAFACHFVVPSLRKNFSTNTKSLQKMLWIGCSLPLFIYILYEMMIISVLPFSGQDGLLAIAASATPLARMQEALGHNGTTLPILISAFSNCALLTSFLGVVMALSDFIQDGMHISKSNPFKTLISAGITLGPPLLLALIMPKGSPGFIIALDYSGLLVAFLFGVLVVAMAWQARYCARLEGAYVMPGGKVALIVLATLSIGIMGAVVASSWKILPSPRNDPAIKYHQQQES